MSTEIEKWKRSLDVVGIPSRDLGIYSLYHLDHLIAEHPLVKSRREPIASFQSVLAALTPDECAQIRTDVLADEAKSKIRK